MDLIKSILVLDPACRPNLEDILDHDFFQKGPKIPRLLPASTLACPPSASYMKKFQVVYDDELETRKDAPGKSLGRQALSVQTLRTYGSRIKLKV